VIGDKGSSWPSFSWIEPPPKLGISNAGTGLSALFPIREVLGVLVFRLREVAVEGGLEDAGLMVNVADADEGPS
jgi:hypothetical protein